MVISHTRCGCTRGGWGCVCVYRGGVPRYMHRRCLYMAHQRIQRIILKCICSQAIMPQHALPRCLTFPIPPSPAANKILANLLALYVAFIINLPMVFKHFLDEPLFSRRDQATVLFQYLSGWFPYSFILQVGSIPSYRGNSGNLQVD